MVTRPIRTTLIGGFLGAGKTTLVNHILRSLANRRIGVLVNDFGDINIDADLIALREGEAIRLSNGCLCCGLGDDLGRALLGVLAQTPRPGHLPPEHLLPEHLLIEASGVAEPWRIAELLRVMPEFEPPMTLVVLDAAQIETQLADRHVGELARSQIDSADALILNKTDRIDAPHRAARLDWLGARWPGIKIVTATHGAIDPRIIDAPPRGARRALTVAARPADAMFAGLRFTDPSPFETQALADAMAALPPWILRLKGIIAVAGESTPRIIQFAGADWTIEPFAGPFPPPGSRIVAIARRAEADPAAFDRLLRGALSV